MRTMESRLSGHQSTKGKPRLSAVAVVALTLALTGASVLPAAARGDDVTRRGNCSGATNWKLKAKADNGRIEVEGEVDSNRNHQRWHWAITHDGGTSARGTATTRAPSGSFEVTRRLVNASGTDTIGWRTRNPASGEVCRGSLRF